LGCLLRGQLGAVDTDNEITHEGLLCSNCELLKPPTRHVSPPVLFRIVRIEKAQYIIHSIPLLEQIPIQSSHAGDLTYKRVARTAVARLIAEADVLIENFRVGIADRLGFGWDAASALNPRLIYASISGFRRDSDEAARPGYDLIAQAMSGLMYANRQPNGDP